jgi:hypothetical protein
LAIIRCDCETSFGSGASGAACVPRSSFRNAEARPSGSPVSSAPEASAWYSRDRLTAIFTMPAAIGPISISRMPSRGLPPCLPPPNMAM